MGPGCPSGVTEQADQRFGIVLGRIKDEQVNRGILFLHAVGVSMCPYSVADTLYPRLGAVTVQESVSVIRAKPGRFLPGELRAERRRYGRDVSRSQRRARCLGTLT
ncbi:hypothetical protein GCM10022265_23700 [Marinobacter xestospongiae]